jgi:ubiquinone/menaquinone biosynthesis C-methylase UbiE
MLTRSDDYIEYCRETARHARDLHDLALRGRKNKEITRSIHERIVAAVELGSDDDLVDVGCGDGTLLRLAHQIGCRSAIGLLATEEEVALLRKEKLDVRQALSDALPIPDASASVVVCNNVLLVVPRKKIPATLQEFYRIAKPGARIFLGEIPFIEPKDPTPHFATRRDLLSHLYRKHGLRSWFGMLRRITWWQLTGKPAVLNSGTAVSFWASAEEFISMSRQARFEFVRYWQHEFPDSRNNYLFRKPS